jgi:tetratricopeptide (TPR) repeat protein
LRSVVALLAVVWCLTGTGSAAAAGDPEHVARAREHYAQGSRLFDLSEYDAALREFKEAYRLVDDPAFLYNIAQCQRKLGNLEEAITFLKRFLRHAPNAKNRRDIEHRIAELEREVAARPARPAAPPAQPAGPPAADETRPNAETGVAAPAPGSAPAPAPASASASASALVSAPTAGASPDLAARPPAAGAPDAAVTARPAPEPDSARPFYTRTWFWLGAGVVVLGAAAAVVLLGSRGGDSGPFCADCDTTAGISP